MSDTPIFEKEGRLALNEALKDITDIEKGAQKLGFGLSDVTTDRDFETLGKWLVQEGLYRKPQIVDPIGKENEIIESIRRFSREKTPKEIYYQEEAQVYLNRFFEERFGIPIHPFQTERILVLPEYKFAEIYSAYSFLGTAPKEGVGGVHIKQLGLIILKDNMRKDAVVEMIHRTTHELAHEQLGKIEISNSLKGFWDLFSEGLTEQTAMEASLDLMLNLDLVPEARKFLDLKDNIGSDKIKASFPYLSSALMISDSRRDRNAISEERDLVIQMSSAYAYLGDRVLLENLTVFMQRHVSEKPDELRNEEEKRLLVDPLSFFIRGIQVGKDEGLTTILKDTFGDGVSEIFRKGRKWIDVMTDLDNLYIKRH